MHAHTHTHKYVTQKDRQQSTKNHKCEKNKKKKEAKFIDAHKQLFPRSKKYSAENAIIRAAISNYEPRVFHPIGFLFQNSHFQTIVGSGALASLFFKRRPSYHTTRETWSTPDGDVFDVQFVLENSDIDDIVVILHGLESSPESPLVTNICEAMLKKHFSCILLSFRGCSGQPNKTPGGYHVGFTADLDLLTERIHSRYPNKRIYLSGFSLGGNVILKFLGELGDSAWSRGIRGSAVTCVPFDPVVSHKNIEEGFNRAVYSVVSVAFLLRLSYLIFRSQNFLMTLKKKAHEQHGRFPGAFDINAVMNCRSLGDFDDAFIAPIYGYKDKFDYYRNNGCKKFLGDIRIPSIAINALDDPIVGSDGLPNQSDYSAESAIRLVYHSFGGHCGFICDRWTLFNYGSNGWLPDELARAVDSIRSSYTSVSM